MTKYNVAWRGAEPHGVTAWRSTACCSTTVGRKAPQPEERCPQGCSSSSPRSSQDRQTPQRRRSEQGAARNTMAEARHDTAWRGMMGRTEYRGTRGIREAQRTVKRPRDAGQSRDLNKGGTPPDLAWRSTACQITARRSAAWKKTRGPGPRGKALHGKTSQDAMAKLRGAKLAQRHGAAWHIAARCRPYEETKGGRPESRDAHRTVTIDVIQSRGQSQQRGTVVWNKEV